MKFRFAAGLICLLPAFAPALMAGESLLWQQEFSEPLSLYASPKLDYFAVSYKSGEEGVSKSSGIAVYDQKWSRIWQDSGAILEDISWHAGVIAVRIQPENQSLNGEEQKVIPAEESGPEGEFFDEAGGKWRILDIYSGEILREFDNYQEAKPVLNALDLFREDDAGKEGWLHIAGPDWKVSGVSDDGLHLTAYNPLSQGYNCSIYKKSSEPGVFWKRVNPCGGGTLIDGGYLLHGENVIPVSPAETEEFVKKRIITLKVTLKSLADKELWNRKITLKHELNNHVLLDYPIAWYSGGKIVVYAGLALKLFDLEGNEGTQIPYASDMENAKKYENRVRDTLAPRLAVFGDGMYFKFYCWDEEENGKFKHRVIKLYKGTL